MTNPTDPSRLDAEALYGILLQQVRSGLSGVANAAIVGIHSGGAWLAERLAHDLGLCARLGVLDVSFYRDDFKEKGLRADIKPTQIGFDVNGATIVLIDDVLYTGRSVRAAINELFDFGRPAAVELAVLVDRGGRQLPYEPTYCGERLTVAEDLSIVLSREGGALRLSAEPVVR